jgi:diacylglycerol kinase
MESKHSLSDNFRFAFEGLKVAFVNGRNFRIEIFTGIAATILGLILRLNSSEWLDLILIIASVLILELMNTAIEAMVDIVSPEIQPKAKIAKDVAAASVLVASIASVFIGAFLFLPKILSFL